MADIAATPPGTAAPRLASLGLTASLGGVLGDSPLATAAFAALALAAMGFAFVGLSRSGFWADELFTLYLVDHHGGAAEVVRRSLTDTHPPAYQLMLHAWTRIAGVSEASARLPSAVFAVAAAAVFAFGLRRVFSPTAIAFATAIGVTSAFWLHQAQNARSYALCMLLTATMATLAVSIRASEREGGRLPLGRWAALTAVGALSAFTHFYALLATGWIMLALIVGVRGWRARVMIAAGGAAILLAALAYMALLFHHTEQNLSHMWFKKGIGHQADDLLSAVKQTVTGPEAFGVAVLLVLLGVQAWRRRKRGEPAPTPADGRGGGLRAWTTGMAGAVVVGVWVTGVAVCYIIAPSMSVQNLLVAAPIYWILLAALYDAATPALASPRARGAVAAGLALLIADHVPDLQGRFLSTTEQWRGSAHYVRDLPACVGAAIPVVEPFRFGPDTPFFRTLFQRDFFGRYFGPRWPTLEAHAPAAFTGADRALAARLVQRARAPGACPVLAWAVHDFDLVGARRLSGGIAALPGMPKGAVRMKVFYTMKRRRFAFYPSPTAFVVEAGPATTARLSAASAPGV